MSTIETYMTDNFQLLSGNLSPAEALAQLNDGYYGIAINANEKPFALFTAEDLEEVASTGADSLLRVKASLPPTIVVGGAIQMEEFAGSGAKRTLVRNEKARGAIIINDSGTVGGVLAVPQFQVYLKSGQYVKRGGELGEANSGNAVNLQASALWGKHKQTTWLEICTVCWHTNEFTDDEWKVLQRIINNPDPVAQQQMPQCQNTAFPSGVHTFKPN
jgi:hypothetical protein